MPSSLTDLGRALEDLFARGFYYHGLLVGRHPAKFLIIPLLFVVAMAPGLLYIRLNLDLYKLFVPLDAPVKEEFERAQQFSKMPNGVLLDKPQAKKIEKLTTTAAPQALIEMPVALALQTCMYLCNSCNNSPEKVFIANRRREWNSNLWVINNNGRIVSSQTIADFQPN